MQVNNETGVRQPIAAIADLLDHHAAYFHVDAAQGYGKDIDPLRHPRIDLISVSGHKVHAPQGIGALIARRRAASAHRWSRFFTEAVRSLASGRVRCLLR